MPTHVPKMKHLILCKSKWIEYFTAFRIYQAYFFRQRQISERGLKQPVSFSKDYLVSRVGTSRLPSWKLTQWDLLTENSLEQSIHFPKTSWVARIWKQPISFPNTYWVARLGKQPISFPNAYWLARLRKQPISFPGTYWVARLCKQPISFPNVYWLARLWKQPILFPKAHWVREFLDPPISFTERPTAWAEFGAADYFVQRILSEEVYWVIKIYSSVLSTGFFPQTLSTEWADFGASRYLSPKIILSMTYYLVSSHFAISEISSCGYQNKEIPTIWNSTLFA